MGLSQTGIAAIGLAIPGLLAFVFAVVAENQKPEDPAAAPNLLYDSSTDQTTCHYPKDPTIALGILAVIFLFISALFSLVAFYFPYNGKKVSTSILWRSTSLVVFTIIALTVYFVAEALLLWAIMLESQHRSSNLHSGAIEECPTAKSGLFGGAGFLALDATLFFLIVLMLTANARSDYLMDVEEADEKGSYGEATSYAPPGIHSADRV